MSETEIKEKPKKRSKSQSDTSVFHVKHGINLGSVLEFKLLPGAKAPQWNGEGAAGLDLFTNDAVRIPGKGHKLVKTGVILAMENWLYAKIEERSGVSLRTPLSIKAGVIDPDYRGEVGIILQNISDYPVDIQEGEKLVQLTFHIRIVPTLVDKTDSDFSLSETERGEKGFGSSDI